jgi:hypothetical protein
MNMNDSVNNVTARKQRSLGDEVVNRRQELRDTILRNFEIARLNLRDTQLSPEAALITFYEGVALSLSTVMDLGGPPAGVPNNAIARRKAT